jgi:hypothetical protein
MTAADACSSSFEIDEIKITNAGENSASKPHQCGALFLKTIVFATIVIPAISISAFPVIHHHLFCVFSVIF